MTATTTEQRVQLLQHLIDHRPISTAGPQVGISPSEAHSIATEYGYPNRRRLQAALEELQNTEEVAEAMAEQSEVETETMRPELDDPEETPAPLELAAAEAGHGLGGARTLGQGVIATTEGPGELGSVINWEGANYVPQPDPEAVSPELEARLAEALDQRDRLQAQLDAVTAKEPVHTGEQFATIAGAHLRRLVSRAQAIGSDRLVKRAEHIVAAVEWLEPTLRDAEARYGNAARIAELQAELAKLRGKPASASSSSRATTGPSAKEMRNWAAHNGVDCSARGRVPANVVDAYRKAHADA